MNGTQNNGILDNAFYKCKFRLVPYKNKTLQYQTILVSYLVPVLGTVTPYLNRYCRRLIYIYRYSYQQVVRMALF
jgi:hypothetical protein